mmetsp:Transcript_26337/g.25518  ORF Transcript_26337/g.25518 Transcript_26337/m.25518 type:complete len:149 (+) Transcript_26337:56-502(+)
MKKIETEEEAIQALRLYNEEAINENPFLTEGIGKEYQEEFFQQQLKFKDAIVTDKISSCLIDLRSKEMVGIVIAVDYMSELSLGKAAEKKVLPLKIRARARLFQLINEGLISMIPFESKEGFLLKFLYGGMKRACAGQHLFKDMLAIV